MIHEALFRNQHARRIQEDALSSSYVYQGLSKYACLNISKREHFEDDFNIQDDSLCTLLEMFHHSFKSIDFCSASLSCQQTCASTFKPCSPRGLPDLKDKTGSFLNYQDLNSDILPRVLQIIENTVEYRKVFFQLTPQLLSLTTCSNTFTYSSTSLHPSNVKSLFLPSTMT